MKINTQDFKEKLENKFPNMYIVESEYINSKTPIKIKCKKCEYEYEIRPHHILGGRKCPRCSKRKKKTTEEFKKEVYDLVGDEYKVLGEYKGTNDKIKMLHKKCNKKFEVTPNNFLSFRCKCSHCYRSTPKKTTEEFKKEVYCLVGNEYKVLEEYTNCHHKIRMLHTKCNKEFEVTPGHFLNGTRCPNCKHSIGEDKIEYYLKHSKIKFKTQVRFKDCKNILPLVFDFQIFTEDNNFILLEYDGEFHYQNIFYEEENKLEKQQLRDNIKNQYCKDNNISLIRISYLNKNNLNSILKNLENKFNFKKEE
jgi:hypothetical protein